MHDIISWCASVRAALASLHPIAPWLVLAALVAAFDHGLRRFGFVRWVQSTYPWGKLASEFLSSVPSLVLGAAWPALTSNDFAVDSAVIGALSAGVGPVLLAIRANLPKPPSGGSGSAVGLTLVLALPGCGVFGSKSPAEVAAYENCRANARVRFHADAERCEDEACIDALSIREELELRECR